MSTNRTLPRPGHASRGCRRARRCRREASMTTWIGRVDPSMWWQGPWWQEMLPPGFRLAILALGVRILRDEELEQAHATILEKVAVLDREGVDVINVGGSPVVGVHGKAGHDRL